MSWEDYALARTYLVESRIGSRLREAKEAEKRRAAESRRNLTKDRRGTR